MSFIPAMSFVVDEKKIDWPSRDQPSSTSGPSSNVRRVSEPLSKRST